MKRTGAHLLDNRAIAVILCAIAIAYSAHTLIGLRGRVGRLDFSTFYIWSSALRNGLNPYRTAINPMLAALHLESAGLQTTFAGAAHSTAAVNFYPPAFLLCFEPLTRMGPAAAYWTWIGINLIAFGAALCMLIAIAPGGSRAAAISLAALAILFHPVGENLFWAQPELILLLLLALAMAGLESGNDALAGVVLAFAGLLKLFPLAIGAYLALRRRWRAIAYCAAALAAGIAASIAIAGPAMCAAFVNSYRGRSLFIDPRFTIALSSHLLRLNRLIRGGPLSAHGGALVTTVAIIMEIAVIAIAAHGTIRSATDPQRPDPAFGLWVAEMVLIAPTSQPVYLVFLLIPYAQLARSIDCGAAPRLAVWLGIASYLAAMAAPRVLNLLGPAASPITLTVWQEIYGLCAVLAFASAYWLAIRGTGNPAR